LDRAALQYKQLIMDPCNAAIVPPVLNGGTGNFIRLKYTVTRSDLASGCTGDPTYFAFAYCPVTASYAHKATTTGGTLLNASPGATASTGTNSLFDGTGRLNPATYLSNIALDFRVVAACVEFTNYTTSNAVRGQLISAPSTPYRIVAAIDQDANAMTSFAENMPRVRVPMFAKWTFRPSDGTCTSAVGGANWPASEDAVATMRDDYICIFLQNVTPSSGGGDFAFTITQVVEYQPRADVGLAPGTVRSKSKNTLDQVLNAIPDKVFDGVASLVEAATPY
jgi:hypothetical protein